MDGASQDVAQFEFIDAPHLLPVYYRPTHDTDDATAVDAQASIPATLPMVPRRAWFFDASIPWSRWRRSTERAETGSSTGCSDSRKVQRGKSCES
jgi:hypothetical protein